MVGYSGTPLPKKLGIKPAHRVALLGAPASFARALGTLPEGTALVDAKKHRGPFDVVVAFAKDKAELERLLPALAKKLDPSGALWAAWPKQASGVLTDLTEGVVQKIGLGIGLVDNKVCAIDATWSGLRFVVRLVDRPAKQKKAPSRRA
jgi:tetrahydromethanopterin S-methyltransferase subunit B